MTTPVSLTIASPVGELVLVAEEAGLAAVLFERNRHEPHVARARDAWRPLADAPDGSAASVLAETRAQLEDYFAGGRTTFDLPLAPHGTEFQRRVWDALCAIPYGETISYLDLARRLGDSKATRAVGAANGRNPIPIIVPCHRVVGADGALTGFGGGIERKRWLLTHEGALLL